MNRSLKMGDPEYSKEIPKKYYRYFLKGLAYYTCHLNRACTKADLQAFVFLKSQQQLSESDLTYLSNQVMDQLVATGLAHDHNGYFRLNEWLRLANGTGPSRQTEPTIRSTDNELSSGSGLKRMVNFSNSVTVWPTDTAMDGVVGTSPLPQLEGFVPHDLLDVESNPATAGDNETDSDSDEEELKPSSNDTKKDELTPEKQKQSDSESSSTTKANEDSSDEDAEQSTVIPHRPIKQEPSDVESDNPDNNEDL